MFIQWDHFLNTGKHIMRRAPSLMFLFYSTSLVLVGWGKVYPQTFLKSFHSFPRARISATAVFVSSGIWRRAHSSVLKQKLFFVQGFCKLQAIMKSLNQFVVSVCNVVFSVSISHCSHFFPWFLSKTLELSGGLVHIFWNKHARRQPTRFFSKT